MATSIFNPRKSYFDLMPIIGYINTPDLFIRKFLSECIMKYSDTTSTTACHLTYQQGHLNNKKLRNDFKLIFSLIIDNISFDKDVAKKIKDSFIVALDNASKSLSVVFEFNDSTTTISVISVPLEPEKQISVHTRKRIYDTHYYSGTLSIFDKNIHTLYTIAGKNNLFNKISEAKHKQPNKEVLVIEYFVPNPIYAEDLNVVNLLKSETISTIGLYTGFNIRDDQKQNFDSSFIKVLVDKDGFYTRIG